MNIILILYITLILVLHLIPLGEGGTSRFDLGFLRADFIMHTLVFIPWMFLVYSTRPRIEDSGNKKQSSSNSRQKWGSFSWIKQRKALSPGAFLFWIFIGIVLAFGAESIQYWVSYRAFNPMDAMFNSLGVLIGAGMVLLVQRSKFEEEVRRET